MPVALRALATVAADKDAVAVEEDAAADGWVESEGEEEYELDEDRKAIWDLRSTRDTYYYNECTRTTHDTLHTLHAPHTTHHTHYIHHKHHTTHTTQGVVRLPDAFSTSG